MCTTLFSIEANGFYANRKYDLLYKQHERAQIVSGWIHCATWKRRLLKCRPNSHSLFEGASFTESLKNNPAGNAMKLGQSRKALFYPPLLLGISSKSFGFFFVLQSEQRLQPVCLSGAAFSPSLGNSHIKIFHCLISWLSWSQSHFLLTLNRLCKIIAVGADEFSI